MARIFSSLRGPRAGAGGFETFSWYYFRISGILAGILVIVHLLIMHISNDVACTTYAFVAMRYSNIFWRVFDWLLLTVALTHGMNGLRVVIDDYVRAPGARMWLLSISAVLLVVFFMLGTLTLITFPTVPGATGPLCIPK